MKDKRRFLARAQNSPRRQGKDCHHNGAEVARRILKFSTHGDTEAQRVTRNFQTNRYLLAIPNFKVQIHTFLNPKSVLRDPFCILSLPGK